MTREEFFKAVSALGLELPKQVYDEFAAIAQTYVDQLEKQIPRWRSVEKDGLPREARVALVTKTDWLYPVSAYWMMFDAKVVWLRQLEGPEDEVVEGEHVELKEPPTHYLPLSDLLEPTEGK